MSRIGWILTDPVSSETYTLTTNPHTDQGSFHIEKPSAYQVSGASFYRSLDGHVRVGDTLIYATPKETSRFSFAGNVYSGEEMMLLYYWVEKNYPVHLTDDLGRNFEIFFDNLSLSRSYRFKNRLKHEYKVTGVVLKELE